MLWPSQNIWTLTQVEKSCLTFKLAKFLQIHATVFYQSEKSSSFLKKADLKLFILEATYLTFKSIFNILEVLTGEILSFGDFLFMFWLKICIIIWDFGKRYVNSHLVRIFFYAFGTESLSSSFLDTVWKDFLPIKIYYWDQMENVSLDCVQTQNCQSCLSLNAHIRRSFRK